MTILFDRVVSIVAQHPEHSDVIIQNLRVKFDIEKFFNATLNTATITIFNLKPENRRLLIKRKVDYEEAPFTTISLIAGYKGIDATIFRGQLVQGFSTRVGPDWITTLQCVTAYDQIVSAHHNTDASFKETTAKDLLDKFFADAGVSSAIKFSATDSVALKLERIAGVSYSGRIIDSVLKILRRYGLEINFDDYEVLISKEFSPVNPENLLTAPLLSIDSGIIGSPQITPVGVKLTTLLTNQLSIMKLFRVESETTKQNDIRGEEIQTFTCTKLKHAGDTHSDTWQSEIHGAWFPEVDFTGKKNVTPGKLQDPSRDSFLFDLDPPVPGTPP